jgi:putative CocE/NonD family hydrolase
MRKKIFWSLIVVAISFAITHQIVTGQGRQGAASPDLIARRNSLEAELQSIAIVERKLMIPMRDGKRMAADLYRPKDTSKKYPTVFSRTPYNFNFWDVRNRVVSDMTNQIEAVKRGYAIITMNERGHFFSEGNYDILGPPLTDGDDALTWMAKQEWSNGKVGTIGCSSTAEWQMAVAAQGNPAFAAMIPQGFGAGVGRVGGYYEQGNWYRGGAVQMLFVAWIMREQNTLRPMFPPDTSQEDLIKASKMFDLVPRMPAVDWSETLSHLPMQDILRSVGASKGIFADKMPVDTGGAMIQREPNDPAWYKGGLYHDTMPLDVPGLYFMSWYDVSVGPNLALYNDQQWAIIAPVAHCAFTRATADTVVGERSMGDARLNYQEIVDAFFDRFVKGAPSPALDALPKVTYYTMGLNKWQSSDVWPPRGAQPMTFFLSGGGRASTLGGDGVLATAPPAADRPDRFTYDPMKPVMSYGGNVCCTGNAITAGSFDQRKMEAREDILVYTSEPFGAGVEVSGPITPTLYVSSDARDTDFTVKVLDVYPDGRAYNLDESIQRMRYRDGYDKPLAWMESGKVYKVTLQPLTTSNYFAPGHRLRIEVSSSNFPRFDRNLNTGGRNFDESKGVVAHNAVHHSTQYPSQVTVTVVKSAGLTPKAKSSPR